MEEQLSVPGSIDQIVSTIVPRNAGKTAIRVDDGEKYVSIGYDEYHRNIRVMANFFAGLEDRSQKVVATFCLNRPEWDMTALAVFYTGNILFPIDTKMNDVELRHFFSLSKPDFILVSAAQRRRLSDALVSAGVSATIVRADLYTVNEDRLPADTWQAREDGELSIAELALQYEGQGLPVPSERLKDIHTVLAYYATSGTVGLPRLVQITHGNIMSQLKESMDILKLRPNEDFLNIGAYTHIATLVEFLVAKSGGNSVVYFTREADEDDVLENEIRKLKKQGVRVKGLMAVPKFWVYIMKETLEELKNRAPLHSIYMLLAHLGKEGTIGSIGAFDRAKLAAARTLLRDKLGGYFTYGISSSTKIDPGIIEIFGQLGITILDIYGATEATGIIAKNRLNQPRPGSCGRLIPSLEARLSRLRRLPGISCEVGELELRGPTVMKGYLNDAAADTERMGADGFFATGDLAWMDGDGFVYLVGRKKELIECRDGSFVDPMHLSNLLVRSIHVKDAMVARLGQDEFLSVFILPDYPRLRKDTEFNERIAAGMPERQALRGLLEVAVREARLLAKSSIPISSERIYILQKKLERTPTHKIKYLFELARVNLGNYV